MITRDDVISSAVDNCIKELYSLAQPSVEWDKFIKENKIYSKRYEAWERYKYLLNKRKELSEKELKEFSSFPSIWKNKSITECIGPRPYEFYYLPRKVMKRICDSYIHAYKLDDQRELLDTIKILKIYCKEPIVDKWIEGENGFPGHRGYDHPDNLKKELSDILDDDIGNAFQSNKEIEELSIKLQNKFFEFLDMAGNFYNWNRDLNSFSMSVYLGPSPNSNKEAVIKNWKQYRNKDIEIDESKYKEEEDE
jgi:hypothetical protein